MTDQTPPPAPSFDSLMASVKDWQADEHGPVENWPLREKIVAAKGEVKALRAHIAAIQAACDAQRTAALVLADRLEQAEDNALQFKADRDAALARLNTPEVKDFAAAVVLEAQHQRARWSTEHDAGKTDADWFWLIGYLAGKALHNPPNEMPPNDARLHRIITVAAAAANWHAATSGSSNAMRPGIEPPAEIAAAPQPKEPT